MDRQSLDEFFAKADDVLTDWNPVVSPDNPDVMHGQAPEPGTEQEPAPAGGSYYEQAAGQSGIQPLCPNCGELDCPVTFLLALVQATAGTAEMEELHRAVTELFAEADRGDGEHQPTEEDANADDLQR